MIDELDHKKKLQYGVVEGSLKLMARNLREPEKIIVRESEKRKTKPKVISLHNDGDAQ